MAAALVGCGGDDDSTDPSTTPGGGPLVTYGKGGGFAPVNQQLVIEDDGTGTATATFAGQKPEERTAEFQLSDAELGELTDAVESVELEPYDNPGTCADCFIYSIGTAQGSTSFDEAMLSGLSGEDAVVPEDVRELNEMLGTILDEHVPGPPPTTGA